VHLDGEKAQSSLEFPPCDLVRIMDPTGCEERSIVKAENPECRTQKDFWQLLQRWRLGNWLTGKGSAAGDERSMGEVRSPPWLCWTQDESRGADRDLTAERARSRRIATHENARMIGILGLSVADPQRARPRAGRAAGRPRIIPYRRLRFD